MRRVVATGAGLLLVRAASHFECGSSDEAHDGKRPIKGLAGLRPTPTRLVCPAMHVVVGWPAWTRELAHVHDRMGTAWLGGGVVDGERIVLLHARRPCPHQRAQDGVPSRTTARPCRPTPSCRQSPRACALSSTCRMCCCACWLKLVVEGVWRGMASAWRTPRHFHVIEGVDQQ